MYTVKSCLRKYYCKSTLFIFRGRCRRNRIPKNTTSLRRLWLPHRRLLICHDRQLRFSNALTYFLKLLVNFQ